MLRRVVVPTVRGVREKQVNERKYQADRHNIDTVVSEKLIDLLALALQHKCRPERLDEQRNRKCCKAECTDKPHRHVLVARSTKQEYHCRQQHKRDCYDGLRRRLLYDDSRLLLNQWSQLVGPQRTQ